MVRITNDNKVYVKILFWGIKGAGKNTAADLLYDATKDGQKKGGIDLKAVGERTCFPIGYDEGLFSDRGVFQSTKKDSIFFHAYTFTGDPSIGNKIPKNLFRGTDGIVFVFDGQRARLNDNTDSISFLEKLTGSDLIEKIPMTILLTKTDTPDAVTREEVEGLLRTKGLMWDEGEPMGLWNPIIFAANLHDEGAKYEVYKAFAESARRAGMYQTFGSGSAPVLDKNTRINLIIPEALKGEWERFSSDVVHASMSQMIRDAVRDYMQKKEQLNKPPAPDQVDVENDALNKRIDAFVVKRMEEMKSMAKNHDHSWTIVVGGSPGVGKSAFLHRYIRGEFLKDSKPSIGCQFHTQSFKRSGIKVMMELWEFGGHYTSLGKKHPCITPPYTAALLLFDLANVQTLEDLRKEWIPLIRETESTSMPIILVGTKMDLVDQDILTTIQATARDFVKEADLTAFKATSSKTGLNITETINFLVDLLI